MKTWRYAVSAASEAPKTAPILLTGDICDCLSTAADIGFDAIEYHMRENAPLDLDRVQKTMDEVGCRISMIVTGRLYTQGGLSLTSDDADNARAALDGMLRYIDTAGKLGAGTVLGWAKGNIRETAGREAYFDRLTRALAVLDEAAEKSGVPIVVEVINHYEVDAFMTAEETAGYLKANGFRNCYVHLDTFHMMLEEEDYGRAIRTAGKKLGYFHLADSTRWYPGSGYIDFKPILRELDAIGYGGYLSLECFPHEDALETARKGLQYLKSVEDAVH